MSVPEYPVVFAGGGLVGLSTAMFLAQHGIRSLAIEKLHTASQLPRAAHFHMRTLEMFRSAGIEDDVRAPCAWGPQERLPRAGKWPGSENAIPELHDGLAPTNWSDARSTIGNMDPRSLMHQQIGLTGPSRTEIASQRSLSTEESSLALAQGTRFGDQWTDHIPLTG